MSAAVTLRGVDFLMYLVDDVARGRAFYEQLFGLTASDIDTEHYVEYTLPDGMTFAVAKDPSTAREPSGGIMFGVTDTEAAIAQIAALGGTLLRRFNGPACITGWCTDPDGNPFGVHQRTS